MIRHVVWWTLKENANGRSMVENVEHIQELSAMLHGLPSLTYVEISAKIQPSCTVPCNLVLMSTHKTMADLEAYRMDPVHIQFAEKVNEIATSRNCIDYAYEPNLMENERI